ncbi:MAG: replicative DNA helicase [Puniceicoccales bacterium]|nr:replicative DNA helicase [Puniceicoccales bacterium]
MAREGKKSENSADSLKKNDLRSMPYSMEVERMLLGCCVLEGGQESLALCIENRITADSFYYPFHRVIFEAISDIHRRGQPLLEGTLLECLEATNRIQLAGGRSYVLQVCDCIDNALHIRHFIDRLRDYELLRRIITVATKIVEQAYGAMMSVAQFVSEAEEQIYSVSQDTIRQSATHIKESVNQAIQMAQMAFMHRGQINGVSTGFIDLDRMLCGLHGGEVIVLAARPSMGKTSMGLNFAESAILPPADRDRVPTLFFSLEMGSDQLAMRLICGRAGIDMSALRNGYTPAGQESRLLSAAKEFSDAPLWIDESSNLTILELRARARRACSQYKIGLIIIDYLQLVSGMDSRTPREQQVAEISRGVKAMAKELKVPVVLLSQLNRESERDGRQPRISDLRESGSIEQDADVVLLLARPRGTSEEDERSAAEEDTPAAGFSLVERELIIAKQRNGPVGVVHLLFDRRLTKFRNQATRE